MTEEPYRWLEAIRTTRLYAYRLPADRFRPFSPTDPYAHVATEAVRPLGPAEPIERRVIRIVRGRA